MYSGAANMNPKQKKILHYISVTGTFMFIYGVIYMILRYTVGLIPFIKNTLLFGVFPLEIPLFIVSTLLIIRKFIRFSSPYRQE